MAFPIFFRRLFANEGAGPLLRGDILPFGSTAGTVCQGDDARLTRAASTSADVDAWRLTWIGVPRWWRSTTLPPHHVWADGSLVLFEDWPEFKACYDAGGFEGMLMPAGSDSAAIAANLGKWVEHPNSLGLYTPSLSGQFFRNWTPESELEAGKHNQAAAPDIIGTFCGGGSNYGSDGSFRTVALSDGFDTNWSGGKWSQIRMQASLSSSVYGKSSTIMPDSINYPVFLYLGCPSKK